MVGRALVPVDIWGQNVCPDLFVSLLLPLFGQVSSSFDFLCDLGGTIDAGKGYQVVNGKIDILLIGIDVNHYGLIDGEPGSAGLSSITNQQVVVGIAARKDLVLPCRYIIEGKRVASSV